MYIHNRTNWTDFTWDNKKVLLQLSETRNLQGKLIGKMESLGFDLQNEAMLNTLQVRDYMIRDPFLLSPSMSVTDAIAVLLAQGLAGAPVVEQGRLVGMFSESDGLKGDEVIDLTIEVSFVKHVTTSDHDYVVL